MLTQRTRRYRVWTYLIYSTVYKNILKVNGFIGKPFVTNDTDFTTVGNDCRIGHGGR